MPKVVFLNFPTHGCINALLGTASELVRRGETVLYYCTEEFRNKIEQTGAEFRPYEGYINEFKFRNFSLFKALKLNIEMTIDKLEHNLESVRKDDPDYIIHDSLCTWGKHIASILRLPAVNLMHSYPFTESSIPRTFEMLSFLIQVGIYNMKNSFSGRSPKRILKKKYNTDLSISDVLINREALNIVYTSKYMSPEIHEAEQSYKFVGPSLFFKEGQQEFPFNELKGKIVIYISLGTLNNRKLNFYNTCIRAFEDKPYFVVISTGYDVQLNELNDMPENIIIRKNVPQQKLLEQTDLFITHAGMNSVNEAMCYGVPMLLLPLQFEQQMIAERVQELGMGIVRSISRMSPDSLFNYSEQILANNNFKRQALKYQALLSEEEKISNIKAADHILHYIDTMKQ